MSPEDELKWALRNSGQPMPQSSPVGQMSPNMISQSAPTMADLMRQSQFDGSGEQQMIIEAMRSGRDNIFSEGPKTRMYGDVAVAPSWGDNLANAAKKAVGGLEMRQARKDQKALTGKQEKAAEAGVLAKTMQMAQEKADAAAADRQKQENWQATYDQRGQIAADKNATSLKKGGDDKPTYLTVDDIPTEKERTKYRKAGETAGNAIRLAKTYKPEFSPPEAVRLAGAGAVQDYIQRRSADDPAFAEFWSEKERYDLKPRHDMFGSAFTKPEQEAWKKTTFGLNDSPEFIQAQLKKREYLERMMAESSAAELFKRGFDPEDIEMKFGRAVDVPQLKKDIADGSYMERRREADSVFREGGEYQYGSLAGDKETPKDSPSYEDEEKEARYQAWKAANPDV